MARRVSRPATIIRAVAIVGVLATVGALAVFAPGFDSTQASPDTGTVWAYAGGSTFRYGSVNTALAELDSIKKVDQPSNLIQTPSQVLMYSRGNSQLASVNVASPIDLIGKSHGAKSIGALDQLSSSANYVAYSTTSGVSGGTLAEAQSGHLPALAMAAKDASGSPYTSTALAVDSAGIVYSYSATLKSVERYSIPDHRILGSDTVQSGPKGDNTTITAINQTWVLLSGNHLWFAGKSPITVDVSGQSKLEQPADGLTGRAAQAVYISDSRGIKSYQLDGSSSSPLVDRSVSGTPAAPTALNGTVYAAWLSPTGPGKLWNSNTSELKPLSYGSEQLNSSNKATPVFQTNGREMILNETTSGWVWTVPDGKLVPSSQAWDANDHSTVQNNQTTTPVQTVVEPKPPVAVSDTFGVRAGQLVTLPVMLNDYDPNEDVLSIVPTSLKGLDPSFATLKVTNNEQDIVAQVAPGATGGATFTYQVTDGTAANGGLQSAPATVTLTVDGSTIENPPKWCGDLQGCLATWPTPQVAPGSKLTVDVLDGWVDPEGDPFFISSATILDGGVGSVAATPQGQIVYQDPNPNAGSATVQVDVQLSDTGGKAVDRVLKIGLTPTPNLVAKSFVAIGEAGQPLNVDVSDHVTGSTRDLKMVSAKSLAAAGTTTISDTTPTFSFVASAPGSYLVDYTVADGSQRQTGLARIIMDSPSATQLTTAPVTAFIQENQDTTIDVMSAVSNPQNLVLLVSDVTASPVAGGDLEANAVAQNQLRISGGSGTGQPGKVGVVNYTVSDGSSNTSATAQGQVTVYLVATPAPVRPIAVDDFVTVRQGAAIDVPVLDNDVAASGSTIQLDPTGVQAPPKAGLAFASGDVVRYLAPSKPGQYDVIYHEFSDRYPELSSAATIHFTVVGNGSNTPPNPVDLTARVTSGQSVSIPFTSYGVDADGDPVTLATVTQQPHNGSASISPDGTSLIYTSFVGSPGGSDQFDYEVRSARGQTGKATVRVAVLAQEDADPSPVTYSDYVTIKAGGQAVVYPTANDIDPSGGSLSLEPKSVVPDLSSQTPAMLAAYNTQLSAMNPRVVGNTVTFSAGDSTGTKSFLYTVRDSTTGSNAEGRIVITVTSGVVPQWPVAKDTALTAVTRPKLSQGIDVVDGKVSWTSGDASKLVLSLVGNPAGFTVIGGTDIKGDLPDDQSATIPFELTGKDFAGGDVHTYGFLRIPKLADTSLSLIPASTWTTPEDVSSTFDLTKYVDMPPGSTLEVDKTASFRTSGIRRGAECKLVGASSVQYSPGVGTIYDDSCTVPVKLSSQTYYSYLVFPVHVKAKHPQPVIGFASLVSSPGTSSAASEDDLRNITTWDGDISGLTYSIASPPSTQFTVAIASDNHTLTAKANNTAIPGSFEIVLVTALGNGVSSPTPIGKIKLVVGPEPSQLPVGGHVTHTCYQPSSPCVVNLVNQAGTGEINPFSDPLTVVSVTNPASCPELTYSLSGTTSLSATWTNTAPGATCTSSFVVRDSGGRQGTGTVTINFQAPPSAPDSLTQVGFTDTSVTLRVSPGAASAAQPALVGFDIYDPSNRQVASCDPSGTCTAITGLQPGVKTTFTAKSFNMVNNVKTESLNSVDDVAWAYASPDAPALSNVQTVYSSASTTSSGALSLTITPSSGGPDIGSYQLDCDGTTQVVPGNGTAAVSVPQIQFPVSCTSLAATAIAAVPPFNGTNASGAQSTSIPVTIAGVPTISAISGSSPTAGEIDISLGSQDTNNGNSLTIVYGVFAEGTFDSADCSTSDGTTVSLAGTGLESSGSSTTFTRLDDTVTHTVVACATNGYGSTVVFATKVAAQPIPAPSGLTYTLAHGSSTGVYSVITPTVSPGTGLTTVFSKSQDGSTGQETVTAKNCLTSDQTICSAGPDPIVTPYDSLQQDPITVSGASLTCQASSSDPTIWAVSGSASWPTFSNVPASASVTGLQWKILDTDSWTDATAQDPVPAAPTQVQIRGKVVVTFTGDDSGLTPYTSDYVTVTCAP